MQYLDIIQSSLDYIEENLKTTITAEELCARAGFSVFHYYRLFQNAVGLPVMQYIGRRRLLWAVYEMAQGSKQIDAALRYGFDTSAGFYKAFQREFGCSPSDYVKRYRVRRPCRVELVKEDHIMITAKRIKAVLTQWDLQDEKTSAYVYPSGFVSENMFYVGDRHVIKAYSLPGKAQNNAAILQALQEAGLSSSAPLPTKTGAKYAFDGEFYFLLTDRIAGQPVPVQELFAPEGLTKARYLGEIIGQLHQVLQRCDHVVCNERNIFEEVRDQWLEAAEKAVELPEGFCREYLERFGMLHEKLPVQIIHRDPNPSNIILEQGKLAGFIDFELSQRSIRIFDPCYAATGILVESGIFAGENPEKAARWLQIYQKLIEGYDAVVKLTPEEKTALPYVVLSIQLICVGYFSGVEKFSELYSLNAAMLRWLLENRNGLEYQA